MGAPTELMKGNAATLILSHLAREPMHGYRIARELEELSEGYFLLREGTLYAHLHELEKQGWIEGYWEQGTGKRDRRRYRITERGRAELARRRDEWRRFSACLSRIIEPAPEM